MFKPFLLRFTPTMMHPGKYHHQTISQTTFFYSTYLPCQFVFEVKPLRAFIIIDWLAPLCVTPNPLPIHIKSLGAYTPEKLVV